MSNEVMMQAFEWETDASGNFYKKLIDDAKELKEKGFDALWLPPMCKGGSDMDVGYGIYDLWDLGEFDQKGTVRTKYGTKDELLKAIKSLQENGIKVYADIVLNHKANADFAETFKATMVDQNDRNKDIGKAHDIKAWTGFDFKNRNKKYSDMVWHYYHFSGVDYDDLTKTSAIFRIMGDGKYWNKGVSNENGNYDYLMNADIDHSHPEVREEIFKWIDWFLDTTNVDGIRYDALKHIDFNFIKDLSKHILEKRENFYMIGEYWLDDENSMGEYLKDTDWTIDLFDVPLHFNFKEASENGNNYDMRQIFDNTLMKERPLNCVTFVDNHDSQPGQALESFIKDWFKEIAYAIILFRKDGYPCIFAGDYYGIGGENPIDGKKEMLDNMISVRKEYAYGQQDDYFDHPQVVGWVRRGEDNSKSPLVVLISTGDMAQKQMFVGEENKGKIFIDKSGKNKEEIKIDDEGNGVFNVGPGQVTYWVRKD
ncbi:MAG: alpha-amylase [Tissierellia bacterium]|nr:alpha-amylase [Tissierellia bacterium]